MKRIVILLILFISFQKSLSFVWVEQNNVIKFTDGTEDGGEGWTYKNTVSNGWVTNDFYFTSSCCSLETKEFDGVTNMGQYCDTCNDQYGIKHFNFDEKMTGSFQLKNLLIQTIEDRV